MQVKRVLVFACTLFLLWTAVAAQDGAQTREITSDDFVKRRPVGSSRPAKNKAKSSRYRYRRKAKRISRSRPRQPVKSKPKIAEAEIGVTMWKLRPKALGDIGPFLPVRIADGATAMWTPERVDEETVFAEGDRVRLAVESSVAGHLYIFNREVYEDGSSGEPYLIFPESLSDDNRVRPGLLVDVPDQSDEFPYFLISTKRRDYSGESLLVVIVPRELTALKADKNGKVESLNVLDDLEDSSEAEIFTRTDGIGEALTQAEANAACGAVERRRGTNCESSTRSLGREASPPQTIYRIRYRSGGPLAFPVLINVGGPAAGFR